MNRRNYFLLLICLFVCLFLGCAGWQKASPAEQEYQKVFEVNLPKAAIYERSLQWLAIAFRDSKAVIEYKNEEQGQIIGRGSVEIATSPGYSGHLGFTLRIEIKDNKYRLTCDGFHKADATRTHLDWYRSKKASAQAIALLDIMADDFYMYLTDQKKAEEW